MKKYGVALFLATSLFYTDVSAHAEGTGDDPNYTEDVMTPEQQEAQIEKEKDLAEFINEKEAESKLRGADDGKYKLMGVPSFQQETYYYCGPATTKQVLDYLNNTSNSQNYYAGKLGTTTAGTDFSLVDNVLNSQQSSNTYLYSSISDYSTWSYRIEYNADKGYPTVLDLKITPQYMPKYNSTVEGHILNVSGYDTRTGPAQIRLTDPFDQGNRGVTLGNVWHPYRGVYDANNAHFRQAMIW